MAKKGEEEEGTPIEEAPVGEQEQPEIEERIPAKSYSQQEVDALKEETKRAEFERMNAVLIQKGVEIKRLEGQLAQTSKPAEEDLAEILLQERKGKASEYGEEDTLIPKLEGILAKRKEAQKQAQLQAYYSKADAIYKKAEEAYGEDDVDSLHAIRTLIRAGDFDLAEKKIAKVKPKEEKKEAEPKDTSPFVSEEAKRKWMEEHGLLESETASPSGGGMMTFTTEQIADREFYEKHREAILKAYAEGKIK